MSGTNGTMPGPDDGSAGDTLAPAPGEVRAEPHVAAPVRRRHPVLKWIGRVALAGLVVFGLVHVYALVLRVSSVPGTMNMVFNAADGTKIDHRPVGFFELSPHLVTAVIAAEDTRFCEHGGIDFEALDKALDDARDGKKLRGASTVSQQTAKNVFLWNGGGFVRKGAEAWFTYVIEFTWTKRRIMTHYLNIAEWGDGLYGAEAASQVRFGKAAKDLTRTEAARLAAVLPSPNKWSADNPGPYVRKRTSTILARMKVVERDRLADCVLDPARWREREKARNAKAERR